MKKYIYQTIVKLIIVIAFSTAIIALFSPDFMFKMLGSSDMEPFSYMYPNTHGGIHADDHVRAMRDRKEAGVIVMVATLALILVVYILYRILKYIYYHYKTSNKAIKKDV